MQAIIYALGLEGMLSAKRDVPLPHAMTDTIEVDGVDYPVMDSWVAVEIENSHGEIITVRRAVKSAVKDRGLIEEFEGPRLSGSLPMEGSRDSFVRRAGAAQREHGFHYRLARFLGWSLPTVSRIDGTEVPLYLECLFPYFFVEQKHGWSGIQARIPSYFGIRDVGRRAAEYILALDEYGAVRQKQRLEAEASEMEDGWRQTVERVAGVAKAGAVVLRGLPAKPTEVAEFSAEAVVATSDGWVSIGTELEQQRSRYASLESSIVPTAGEVSSSLELEASELQDRLTAVNALTASALSELHESVSRKSGLETRVAALEEDLLRHKDAALLRRLGSRHTSIVSGESHCPTCQQPLLDGFEITVDPMTPDENIAYIEQELRTFRAMYDDISRIVEVNRSKVAGFRSEGVTLQREIRAVRQSLVSAESTPSIASIAERVRLEASIQSLEAIQSEVFGASEELRSRSARWAENRQALRGLSNRQRSQQDLSKIAALQHSLREQLASYHFNSLAPGSIDIDPDTYRPTHEGFDLGFDLSASDMIRVIWAYLQAFLEASMSFGANHLGLLIFDEPRQQETNRLSFAALLDRAARNGVAGAQIIFATSEEREALQGMLGEARHHLISTPPGQKLLRRLS